MAQAETAFSAMSFWKTVEKKNTDSAIKDSFSKAAPKKLSFPLLQPPPPPPNPDENPINQKEWNEKNVTVAFDFWKQKSVQLQEETERYNARRSLRQTMDFTNLLKKSSSGELEITTTTTTTSSSSVISPGRGLGSKSDLAKLVDQVRQQSKQQLTDQQLQSQTLPGSLNAISSQDSISVSDISANNLNDNSKQIDQFVEIDGTMKKSGGMSPLKKDYRRSRSISCENLPVVIDLVDSKPVAQQPQTPQDIESSEEDSDESDSSEEESDDSSEEENSTFVPTAVNPLKDSNIVVVPPTAVEVINKPDQAANLASVDTSINTIQNDSNITKSVEPKSEPISIPSANNTNNNNSTFISSTSSTPVSSSPSTSSKVNTPISSSPSINSSIALDKSGRPINKSKDGKHKSIGATLTRTVTKTFMKDEKPLVSSTDSKTEKTKKSKLTKEEKERIKKEKKDKKKAEKDQKKNSKDSKRPISKTLSLSEIKKPQQQIQNSIKTFGIKLKQLVQRNNGDLPNILESSINNLSISEEIDVQKLFIDSEGDSKVKEIRKRSDTELIDFSKVSESPIVMAGLLVLFFSELPQPLINLKYNNDLIEINDITNPQVKINDLKNLITSLSQLRRSVLQLIITFFQTKYINPSGTNKSNTISILSKCFGPLLMIRPNDQLTQQQQLSLTSSQLSQLSVDILKLIIENYVFIFEKTEQNDIKFITSPEGKLIITEASIDKLIDKATDYYYLYNEKYFSLTFFISHIYFIQPNELVDKLVSLFKENHVDSKKKWKKERRSKKASCISDSVKLWVDYCYKELREDKKLSQKILKGFPHLEAQLSSRLTHRFAISDILKVPKFHARSRSASFSESFLTNPGSKDLPSPLEIAEQCTLVDYDLFTNVRISDWVRLVQGTVDPTTAPALSSALKKSTVWCQWAMGEILSCEDKSQRAAVISLLVDIACHCRDLANFNASISIYNAIANHHVKRLTQTWEVVPKETLNKIQLLEQSFQLWTAKIENPQASFNAICSSINSACIPHFSLLRTILTQLDSKIPTKTADGLINAEKLRTIFSVVVDLQRLQQQRNYTMKPTKMFIQLQDINTLTMDELADLSLKAEPPVSKAKKYDSPDQSVTLDWKQQIVKTHSKPLLQTSVGIDLPRLAGNFIFKQADGSDVVINNGNKIYDILSVIENLSKMVQSEISEKVTAEYPNHIPLTTSPDSDIKRELLKFLEEVVGGESPVVSVLKLCNQAIIAPVVIELTLNICKIPFMDSGGWKIQVQKLSPDNNNNSNNILIKNFKKQRSRSNDSKSYFEFEWYLQMELSNDYKSVSGFDLKVSTLTLSNELPQALKDQLLESFKNYLLNQDCIKYINLNQEDNSQNSE